MAATTTRTPMAQLITMMGRVVVPILLLVVEALVVALAVAQVEAQVALQMEARSRVV